MISIKNRVIELTKVGNMTNVSINNSLIQKNYFINFVRCVENLENTGFATDEKLNNFFVQRNSKNYFVQRNFWSQKFQWFKKILELIYIYKYIQNIFFYNISKNTIIGGIGNDSR
jgi:hypothetical protein